MAATGTRGMRMAAIDGCDRDAWQPKTAADGDTERADDGAALYILTVGKGEGLLEGVIF